MTSRQALIEDAPWVACVHAVPRIFLHRPRRAVFFLSCSHQGTHALNHDSQASKVLAQVLVYTTQVFTRAFVDAYRQAAASMLAELEGSCFNDTVVLLPVLFGEGGYQFEPSMGMTIELAMRRLLCGEPN